LQTAGLAFSPNICANGQKHRKINSLKEEAVYIPTDLLTKVVDISFHLFLTSPASPPLLASLARTVQKSHIEINIRPQVPLYFPLSSSPWDVLKPSFEVDIHPPALFAYPETTCPGCSEIISRNQ